MRCSRAAPSTSQPQAPPSIGESDDPAPDQRSAQARRECSMEKATAVRKSQKGGVRTYVEWNGSRPIVEKKGAEGATASPRQEDACETSAAAERRKFSGQESRDEERARPVLEGAVNGKIPSHARWTWKA